MITNMHTNIMGTLSFDGKFMGMRKAQDFIVYPMHGESEWIKVQSKTRIGGINLKSGEVKLCPPVQSGAYAQHLALIQHSGVLDSETLFTLKAHIMGTASGKAGTNGVVYTNNSGALEVFK